jgi:hypothetical protein
MGCKWDAVVIALLNCKEGVHCAPGIIRDYKSTLGIFKEFTNPDLDNPEDLKNAALTFPKDDDNSYV